MPETDRPILSVRNLQTTFFTEKETIRAVDGVWFDIFPGETVGIVGESGSGKSVTARSIMRLIKSPGRILDGSSIRYYHLETVREFASRFPGRTVDLTNVELDAATRRSAAIEPPRWIPEERDGEGGPADVISVGAEARIDFLTPTDCIFVTEGDAETPGEIEAGFIDIARTRGKASRAIRGDRIAMIFQDPLTSLNPVYSVGNQIKESLRLHRGIKGRAATDAAVELLEAVGISDARRRVREYPHQFSGGMRQRAMIAMALASEPDVLICDEPTTALDVTIQAQILELLDDLQNERDLSIMFITHDMGVIARISDRVNVMYAGEIIETGSVDAIFDRPCHPYTVGLMESIPGTQAGDRLNTIPGTVPTPTEPATDCRFAPRCPKAFDECTQIHPIQVPVDAESEGHYAACLLYPEDEERERALARHRGTEPPVPGGEQQ